MRWLFIRKSVVIKNIFDRTVAFIGLLCLSPVLLVVSILIKVKMPGDPVIFRQRRVGRHGKPFTIYKFRSMVANPTKGVYVAAAEQHRVTSLGEKLRRYKLDELPELWNVLKGDMSFVGPRPDVPGYADRLQGEDREILELRPGITGPATLKYRGEEYMLAAVGEFFATGKAVDGLPTDFAMVIKEKDIHDIIDYNDKVIYPDKIRLNRYYLRHYSFLKDMEMIICTVLGRKMKYGEEWI